MKSIFRQNLALYREFSGYEPGRLRLDALALAYGVPLVVAAASFLVDVPPNSGLIVTLFTVLAGFHFSLMATTLGWISAERDQQIPADLSPQQRVHRHNRLYLLKLIHTSMAYGFLVALAGAVIAGVIALTSGGSWQLWRSVVFAVVAALAAHLVLDMVATVRRAFHLAHAEPLRRPAETPPNTLEQLLSR